MTQKQIETENKSINGFDTFNDAVISTAIEHSIDF